MNYKYKRGDDMMYKILVRDGGVNQWEFVLDPYGSEAEFDDLNTVLEKVRNLLDFYTRKDIKIVAETRFTTEVKEVEHL